MVGEKEIRLLPIEQWCYTKKIFLENHYFSGVLVYTRQMSKDYKIVPKDAANHLYLYKEEEYPCDVLDQVILSSIQEKFPDVTCRTHLRGSSMDIDDAKRWIEGREKKDVPLYIRAVENKQLPGIPFPISVPLREFGISLELYTLKGTKNDSLFAVDMIYSCDSDTYLQLRELAKGTYNIIKFN